MTDDEKAQAVQEALTPSPRWAYQDQGGIHTITEREILATYWNYWKDEMYRVLRQDDISPEHCIEDFVTIHWAYRVDD